MEADADYNKANKGSTPQAEEAEDLPYPFLYINEPVFYSILYFYPDPCPDFHCSKLHLFQYAGVSKVGGAVELFPFISG